MTRPSTFIAISAGATHSLVVGRGGSLWAFGANETGQLGDDTETQRPEPERVLEQVVGVSAGARHSLVLRRYGSLWAAGHNTAGQLGGDGTFSRSNFREVMTGVARISAGDHHSLALKHNGTLWVFGFNATGQLGLGHTENQAVPLPTMTDVADISAGDDHSLILKAGGSLWACGDNSAGQLGDETTENRLSPVNVLNDVVTMSAGGQHSLAVKTDGTLWAWGKDEFGQLGDGLDLKGRLPDPITRPPLEVMSGVAAVSAGYAFSLALKQDGSLWSFGVNGQGQLGQGSVRIREYYGEPSDPPAQIMTDVAQISAGGDHSLVIKRDGSLWGFGGNSDGQLGDGTTTNRPLPVLLMPSH